MPRPPTQTPRTVSIVTGSVTAAASAVFLELIPVGRAVRILQVMLLNATATGEAILERCTAPYTGGTSTAATVTPGDSTQPATTLTGKVYTVTPTGGGASPAQLADLTTGTADRLPALDLAGFAIVIQPGQILSIRNNVTSAHVYRFQLVAEEL